MSMAARRPAAARWPGRSARPPARGSAWCRRAARRRRRRGPRVPLNRALGRPVRPVGNAAAAGIGVAPRGPASGSPGRMRSGRAPPAGRPARIAAAAGSVAAVSEETPDRERTWSTDRPPPRPRGTGPPAPATTPARRLSSGNPSSCPSLSCPEEARRRRIALTCPRCQALPSRPPHPISSSRSIPSTDFETKSCSSHNVCLHKNLRRLRSPVHPGARQPRPAGKSPREFRLADCDRSSGRKRLGDRGEAPGRSDSASGPPKVRQSCLTPIGSVRSDGVRQDGGTYDPDRRWPPRTPTPGLGPIDPVELHEDRGRVLRPMPR